MRPLRTHSSQLALSTNTASPVYAERYACDAASRLSSLSNGTYSAVNGYLANSPLVSTIMLKQNSTTRMTTANSDDFLNRSLAISSVASASSAVNYSYLYNSANQRTERREPDSSLRLRQYDSPDQAATANPCRFSTKFTDDQSDFPYYGLRYCNPGTGRWLSRDLLRERGERDLCTYVGNDPVNRLDPLGLIEVCVATWNRHVPSVRHVAIVNAGDGNIILSQFPDPHRWHGKNEPLDYLETLRKAERDPDRGFKAHVPDDEAFHAVVKDQTSRLGWD